MPMGQTKWRLNGSTKEQFMEPLKCSAGEPVWYPLIPFGQFEYQDPASGEVFGFEVTDQYLNEMVGHIKGGNYGPSGIPIDEDNMHQTLPEGADAWIKDLEVREGGLWALVQPTQQGLDAIESRPYISPKFTIGDGVDPKYQLSNFIRSGALVSQPWFWPQPGLTISASMSTLPVDDSSDGTSTVDGAAQMENEHPEGGNTMSPEEIAQLEQDLADAHAALETAATEKEALEAQVAEITARAEAAEAASADLNTRMEAIEALLANKETEAKIAEKVNELAQVRVEETIKPEDGEAFTEERALDPEYIQVAASAAVLGTAESMQALNVFIAGHGHKIPTVSLGNKPNLKPITAPIAASAGTGEALTEEQKLEAWSATDGRKAEVRTAMGTGLSFEDAKRAVLQKGII